MFGRAYGGGETKSLALRMKAGQQLVFGEQIGWIGPEIINEGRALPSATSGQAALASAALLRRR